MTTHRRLSPTANLVNHPAITRVVGAPGSPARQASGGLLAMIATGALWGMVFVGPELVPHASASAVVGGRYVLFGLTAGILGRRHLRGAPWARAAAFAFTGFLGYYLLVVLAVQRAGAAPVTVVVGTTPVVYALVGARRERLDLRRLAGPLAVLLTGIVLVHAVDVTSATERSLSDLLSGLALAALSVAIWIWYGLHNATWLRTTSWTSSAWTAVVGTATGVLAVPLLAHGLVVEHTAVTPRLVALWVVLGLGPAWLGTITWNVASRLLPETLTGPLLVIETMFALAYAHLVHASMPTPLTMVGYLLLTSGVLAAYAAVRTNQRHLAALATAAT